VLYATLSDFGRLGLPAAALQGVSDADKLAHLESASDIAEGYLRQRYELPLVWELLALAERAASGTGPVVDTAGAGSIQLLLDVAGLYPIGVSLAVTLEHSDDGATGWAAAGAFATKTAAGTERRVFGSKASPLRRFLRVVYVITGTAPKVRFGVAVAADDLRAQVCAIAAYLALSVRGFRPQSEDENVRLRYEDAMRWLRELAAGRVDPGLIDSTPATEDGGVVSFSAPPRGW
jgi:phage gp36-like protein